MQQVDITEKTTSELKELAYDMMVELQNLQNNIVILNQEIQKRSTIGGMQDGSN